MLRLRGEELPEFFEVLQRWLPQQPWFPASAGRWTLKRTGGLRLSVPQGESDPRLFLELHIFVVRGADGGEQRISVPLALRSRPSALVGKDAFIGRLSHEELGEIWVYNGARDRAFLAAWLEMARREQGTRNGRARAEAYNGFGGYEPFTVRLRRSCQDAGSVTRVLVTPEGDSGTSWESRVVIDFLRRPEPGAAEEYDLLEALAAAKARRVPHLLGVVGGAWEQSDAAGSTTATGYSGTPGDVVWEYGDLALIREGTLAAPDAEAVAGEVAVVGGDFTEEARGIGQALADVHADFAAAFGTYPQTAVQSEEASKEATSALEHAWRAVAESPESSHQERQRTEARVEALRSSLRAENEPLMLQTVHGALGLESFRRPETDRGWLVDESGGVKDHALPLVDVATVFAALTEIAELFDVSAVLRAFIEGLAGGDSDTSWISSALFRAYAMVQLLELRSSRSLAEADFEQICTVLLDGVNGIDDSGSA